MASSGELEAIQGYHNIKAAEAQELLHPHMKSDGCYLLRPSNDGKGGVLCTICVTNRSKLVNYRLVKDKGGRYYIRSNASFPSILLLLAHYKTTPINPEVNTRLLNPVLSVQQKSKRVRQQTDEMCAVKERSLKESPGPTSQDNANNIPGLHLYLPKEDINTVMSQYLDTDGFYLVRPSATADGQLTLAVSHGGKVRNFKIINNGDSEFYISPRRRFPTAQALLSAYRTSPIRSKEDGSTKILLLYPIPVDPVMEEKRKEMLEGKALDFSSYVSSLPASARPLLEQQLDWNHEGVDRDLITIAHHMLDWEEKLCSHLELTEVDVHDIKAIHRDNPELQRREALRRWKNKERLRATYGNLLKLFVKAGHTQCANAVCDTLSSSVAEQAKMQDRGSVTVVQTHS